MICPIDQTQLIITERQGVEIDYCPKCRGVWLDRGELDKIIERGTGFAQSAPRTERREEPVYREHREYDDDDERRHHGHDGKRHHKKESFLGDLFDF